VFPVDRNKTWDGNAYNTIGAWDYKLVDANIKRTIAGKGFDSTAQVLQINKINVIEKKYYMEIFAKNVGLVYKEVIDVTTSNDLSKPFLQRVTGGVISYKATVNSYGFN
jgi:hypothetical protein